MSRDPRKKERQRLKRKQKKLKMRRENSRTILQRIGAEGGSLECWVNDGWQDAGMAAILVLGESHGRFACAMFLVDIWCVGLKDAWGRPEVGEADFRDEILQNWAEQYDARKLSPAKAAKLVCGGIRFARLNGFRLPPHWDRWVSIFGKSLGDPATADVSGFGIDGKLRYIGDMDFLRKRLFACTPEEFIERADVEWIMPPDGADDFPEYEDYFDDESEGEEDDDFDEAEAAEELAGMMERLSDALDAAVRKWCFARGVAPEPKLKEGAALMLGSMLPTALTSDPEEDVKAFDSDAMLEVAATLLERYPVSERDSVVRAGEQIRMYMSSFATPDEAIKSLGLEELG